MLKVQVPTNKGYKLVAVPVELLLKYPGAQVSSKVNDKVWLKANTLSLFNKGPDTLFLSVQNGEEDITIGDLPVGGYVGLVGMVGKTLTVLPVSGGTFGEARELTIAAGPLQLYGSASENAVRAVVPGTKAFSQLGGTSRQLTAKEAAQARWLQQRLTALRKSGRANSARFRTYRSQLLALRARGELRQLNKVLFVLAWIQGGTLPLPPGVFPFPSTWLTFLTDWQTNWFAQLPPIAGPVVSPGFVGVRPIGTGRPGTGGRPIAGKPSTGTKRPVSGRPPTGRSGGAFDPSKIAFVPATRLLGCFVDYQNPAKTERLVYVFFKNQADCSTYREVKQGGLWFADKDVSGKFKFANSALQLTLTGAKPTSYTVSSSPKGGLLKVTTPQGDRYWTRIN